ncbi:MAG: hypothetical protein BWY82_00649 [Verrucomicrobia bacterium ADurb.Bin474]|nr:MAG: hypothetical protein BWY82_00649 [Verrucomicrobia bacterium ADurb.Bin474]
MWPEGLIASIASDVKESYINNVCPLGSLRSAARTMPGLSGVEGLQVLNTKICSHAETPKTAKEG